MLASTFMDMVLGIDIHFEMVPMPAPVPTPIPNPFVGMVFDPGGLLVGQPMSLAAALQTGQAPRGPVLINLMPATTVGANALNSLGVPHILIPPGTAWAPMPKLPKPSFKGPPPPPGPPVAPEGDAIVVFGSPTVTLMGTSGSRMGDKAMSCGEPVRLPSSTILAIPKGMPVLIGGPPAISISDAQGALLKSKWIAGSLHDLLSRMSPGRLRNLLSKQVCFLTGHPVDVATGRVLTDHVDWELPGPLPVKFERNYFSAWANRTGPLGHGWSHSLDQAVWAERGKVVYLDEEGRELEFDTFDFPDHVMQTGHEVYEPRSRLTLRARSNRHFEIATHDGVTLEFARVEGASGDRKGWSRLVRKTARDGATLALEYDRDGHLAWVHDAAGRSIAFEHDRAGRLQAVKLPHPVQAGWQVHTRFAYDDAGDLVAATDPLGNSWRFAYKQHVLVQETNRNGLSFYFAYDGHGEDAYCVRTWGDGGIYDHVLDYDKLGKVTCVTNSLGRTTMYRMNVVGCVVEVIDALGGSTKYEYDERTLRKLKETDAVGGETTWTYDARGNTTKVTGPDGAAVALEFSEQNQPVRAIDAQGGEWQWGYDGSGRLLGRVDAMERRTSFRWQTDAQRRGDPRDGGDADDSRPAQPRRGSRVTPVGRTTGNGWDVRAISTRAIKRLVGLKDPAGQQTTLGYDTQGNVTELRTPDGAESKWTYDNLGRCTTAIDAKKNLQRREHDDLGRVVRVWEPDGNVRELSYDGEGNVVHVRDNQHDVRFTYQGMGRVASRTEAGTTVGFAYDAEERLIGITNEHGLVYRFELDAVGKVEVELGFDGIRRRCIRDKAGRVTKVFRPANRTTEYAYDEAGRVVGVRHNTGEAEAYTYRADGEMIEAANGSAVVNLERDLLGRVVREVVGDDWIASDYDALGRRVRVRSSKGLDQRIARDAMGRAVGVRAKVGAATGSGETGADWEARITRDVLGLEVERILPGGVRARWERDAVGRPIKQEVTAGGEFRRAVQYTWDVNDRLRMVIDATRGPTKYEHDALGNLAAAIYADGRVDLRMPDAVGNLFRTADRSDRKYGPAGQLLAAQRDDGGVTKYEYDAEGNLVKKVELAAGAGPDSMDGARVWTYHWNGTGMLAKVVRPDGDEVTFAYDALARRRSKTFRGRTTRWIWDGNVPLHEWVEGASAAGAATEGLSTDDAALDEAASVRKKTEAAARPALGPPCEVGPFDALITWLFEPEGFVPMAKVVGDDRQAILFDHIGTPTAMYDASGKEVWSASIDAYGNLREVTGDRHACPFRWPGQCEDAETNLYYNRFRYYDPASGGYLSQDPLECAKNVASYVSDPLSRTDPLGLIEWADPSTINYSQAYVTGQTATYEQAMRDGTWDWNRRSRSGTNVAVLTVAEVDGQLVSFDNRRLLAAQNAGMKRVGIQKINLADIKPGTSITWEESLRRRLNSSPEHSGLPEVQLPSNGTSEKPKVAKCR